jgi:hypothetical protein
MGFEVEYADVLQNIEFAIVRVYRQNPMLIDYQVEQALGKLIRVYRAKSQGREPPDVQLAPLAQEVCTSVEQICEWRLGKDVFVEQGSLKPPKPGPLSIDELLACLKRIRKSVQRWNKQGGRQGYLTFVQKYIA